MIVAINYYHSNWFYDEALKWTPCGKKIVTIVLSDGHHAQMWHNVMTSHRLSMISFNDVMSSRFVPAWHCVWHDDIACNDMWCHHVITSLNDIILKRCEVIMFCARVTLCVTWWHHIIIACGQWAWWMHHKQLPTISHGKNMGHTF